MQFQVPQNIAMEDKIVGPLTAIQFSIAVIGGLSSFFIFTSNAIPSPINQLVGGFLGITTLFLAVGRFNDQPMYRFVRHIFYFAFRPKTRIWRKAGAETQLIKASPPKKDDSHMHASRNVSKGDIARLAVLLDSRGSAGSIPKVVAPLGAAKGIPSKPSKS